MKTNEGLESLKTRRSVRSYQDKQITDEELQTILQIVTDGPTAHNKQMYHFSVVQDRQLLDHLSENIRQMMLKGNEVQKKKASTPGYAPLHHAPTVIFVSGELQSDFHVQTDCGIAAGLIVAAATAMGVSSCITASSLFMFKSDEGAEIKKKLGIPDNQQAVCTVALGYCEGDYPEKPEKKTDLVTFVR